MQSWSIPGRGPAVAQSQAEREWRQALNAAGYQVAPTTIRVHPSQLLNPGGNKRAAEAAYREFIAAEPDNLMALDGMAFLLQHRGAAAEARQVRRQRYGAEMKNLGVPEAEIAGAVAFLEASLGDRPAPAAPPPVYVEKLFDEFSVIYDEQLLKTLKYRAPQLIREAVQQIVGDHSGSLDILDLGCGTGLAGAEFRPWARRLTGIDLSPKMLELARARGVYDELRQAEIVRDLNETEQRFDLIVSSDVLNYFGDHSPVFSGIARVLRQGGHCAITTELGEDREFRLRGMRRYQHSREYLERTAAAAGLTLRSLDEVVLRTQLGEPVRGWRGVWSAD
ncbi:MAG: methyltransferase domain-containing protein [Planctomycetaceae bacterium]|nr:methyltransferase domain-containing protein [Planctomycetaceae bacterium]